MYPKKELQQLNLQRELTKRLTFVKQRMLDVMVEFNFVQGKLVELPDFMKRPPDWALDASRLYWETGMSTVFKNLTKEDFENDPRGCLRGLIAIFEGMRSYVVNPRHDPALPVEAHDATDKLHSFASRIVAKKFVTQLRRLDARFEHLLPSATSQQLLDYSDRYQRGIRATVGSNGEIFENHTMTSQIYHIVWFFWPEFVRKPKLSAADLHKWLGDELGLFTSSKLVERIHTKLKLSSRFARAPQTT